MIPRTLHCCGFSALSLWRDATPLFPLTTQYTQPQDYPEDNFTTIYPIWDLYIGEYPARRQLQAGKRHNPTRSLLMEIQVGDLRNLMADSSITVTGIPILIEGGCWARRQLHAGIRYVPVASRLRISLASVKRRHSTLAEFYLMADSSTTVRGIPIRIVGGCWARCQLRNGIKYVPTPWIFMKLPVGPRGVPGGAMGEVHGRAMREVPAIFIYSTRNRKFNRRLL